MLAFFGNLAPLEFIVILVVAILVFGRDLPTVALRGFAHLRKLRRSLEDLRRETGIDRELRNIERSMQEAAYQAAIKPKIAAPPEPRSERLPAASLAETVVDAVEVPGEEDLAEDQPDTGPSVAEVLPEEDRGPSEEERRGDTQGPA